MLNISIFPPYSMQYAAADPLMAAYAGAERYQLVTSQPTMTGFPPGATARYAIPAMATAAQYAAAG